MQNQKKDVDGRTNERTDGRTDGLTWSLLELLITAKKQQNFQSKKLHQYLQLHSQTIFSKNVKSN